MISQLLPFTTDGRDRLFNLLFGFDGRIARTQYWLSFPIIGVMNLLALMLFGLLGWLLSGYIAIGVTIIAWILIFNAGLAVAVKRLHDRGKSGGWLLLYYVAPILLHLAAGWLEAGAIAFEFASAALIVWAIVELGFLPGKVGENAYGPDPLAEPGAVSVVGLD
ncbi:DUF805 domain-containing protein [Bradyrhizobium sp. SSBR45G]|uniref:DUF805 domain-containing protein n=1 Tax=unclassified Bradyrhizobium TaxID=2631580 RepID=UPI0023429C5F|nr:MULTISPECIES: DUF805 domain-containing protein [unclassified Bradyrhizobium]GLH80373.1 DUF805 domain-containing protein [Bradyrhizobium sp. SSBR45G]GLH84791.1 DUF805 domain-containing protein [Bradyrhizobium sp. SSBR45R]